MAAPCEANVLYTCDEKRVIRVIQMCHKLGYTSVVLNNVWRDTTFVPPGGKKTKDKQKLKPVPPEIINASVLKKIGHHKDLHDLKDLTIYTRFTMILEDAGQVRILQRDENVNSYDILSAKVNSEKMHDLACKTCDVDIITFDLGEKMPFYFSRPPIKMAVSRGIHFEIDYAPMLISREIKRRTISNAQILVEYTKGKNILLCGGCLEESDTRGQHDVIILGTLFGLTEEQSAASISSNCRKMILHAEGRKTMLGVVKMVHVSAVKPEDRWRIDRGRVYDSDQETGSDDSDGESSDQSSREEPLHKKVKSSHSSTPS